MTGTRSACLLVCLLVLPATVPAQEAIVFGTVRDSATGEVLPGARVQLRNATGEVVHAIETDNRGRYRLRGPGGRYSLSFTGIGFRAAEVTGLTLDPGTTSRMDLTLARQPLLLAPVEVVSRKPEEALNAPGALTIVRREAIAERTALAVSDHLLDATGVDLASKGLGKATYSARGPNTASSAALLVLQDHRLASIPSLRLNVPYLIPATSEDIERIEIARGPSSAIYGPNADRGVVHIITRSPFASRGATLSLSAGERSVRMAAIRVAGRLGEKVAARLSGEYLAGDDWEFRDTNEVVARDSRVERAGGTARLDWRPDDRTTLVLAGGLTQAIRNVDLTSIGSIQIRDWRYMFGQARVSRDRLFVNLYYNASDAGESFQLYNGAPLVDDSRALSAQVQHGTLLGSAIDLTYGADLQRVEPRTGRTFHGRNEDRDEMTEVGAYLNAWLALSARWSVIVAARGDHHNRLDDFVISPRVGLVFQPASNHALRLTFNRATSTPTATDLFLDLQVRSNLDGLPFEIRTRGMNEAYTFRRDCSGGLCMRSPFIGDGTAFLPLDATVAWDGLVAILQSKGVDISQIPRPSASDVGTVLGRFNVETRAFDPVLVGDVTDVPAGKRTWNTTVETGYRGFFGKRFSLSLDVYRSRVTNLTSSRSVQTPNAFLEAGSLAAYLGRYLPAAEASALAGAAARVPLGIISPVQGDSTEILVLSRQGAKVTYWGADLEAAADVGRYVTITGHYSWTSEDILRSPGGFADIVFNAPQHKGGLGATFRHPASGLSAGLRGRAVSSFPVRSGEYQGQVESYLIVDGEVGYRLPWIPTVSVRLSAANLLDHRHQEFVGAPAIGRLVIARVRAEL